MRAGSCRARTGRPEGDLLPRVPPHESREHPEVRPVCSRCPQATELPSWDPCCGSVSLSYYPDASPWPSCAHPHPVRGKQALSVSQRGQVCGDTTPCASRARAYLAPVLTSAQRLLQNSKVYPEEIALSPRPDRTGVSKPMPTWGA